MKEKFAQSCPAPCDPKDHTVHEILPDQNTGEGSLSLLQGIFPTQGSNPDLPHCRRTLYQLSHSGSPQGVQDDVVWHSSKFKYRVTPGDPEIPFLNPITQMSMAALFIRAINGNNSNINQLMNG